MNDSISVSMSRKAYNLYMKRKDGFKSRKQLIDYLNKTGGYLGTVTDIIVEADPIVVEREDEDKWL